MENENPKKEKKGFFNETAQMLKENNLDIFLFAPMAIGLTIMAPFMLSTLTSLTAVNVLTAAFITGSTIVFDIIAGKSLAMRHKEKDWPKFNKFKF